MKRKIQSMVVLVLVLSLLCSNVTFATDQNILNQVRETYEQAKSKKGVDDDFFYGRCNSLTGYQLLASNIITEGNTGDYPNTNAYGRNWYPFYKMQDGKITSTGYKIICFDGNNCLEELVNGYGSPIFNIVVGFDASGKVPLGHVLYIYAIIDNYVYYTDNVPGEIGKPKVHTIDGFKQFYLNHNGTPQGAVYFQRVTGGWYQVGDNWRYGQGDGTDLKGWLADSASGKRYYFDNNGNMVVGWVKIDGKNVCFDDNGEQHVGWAPYNGDWYYFYESGDRATGWLNVDGNDYYMNKNGKMYSGVCMTIDGIEYDISTDGVVSKSENTKKVDEILPNPNPNTTDPNENGSFANNSNLNNEKRQYKYRIREKKYEYTTSTEPDLEGWELIDTVQNGKWGEWSDWSPEYVSSSENVEVKTRKLTTSEVQQIYLGRYYSNITNKFSPSKLDDSYSFEGGWFNEDDVTFVGQAYAGGRSDCYTVSGYNYYFFEIGSHGGERKSVSTGETTEYKYREKSNNTTYKYRRQVYTEWSQWKWSDTPVEGSDTVELGTESA